MSHHGLSTEAVPGSMCGPTSMSAGVNERPRQEVTCSGLSRMTPVPPTWPCLSGSQAIACHLSSMVRPWGQGLGRDREPCCPDVTLPAFAGGVRQPVSCEQSSEESGLPRPGDGCEQLLGDSSHQQEQGKCPRPATPPGLWDRCGGRGRPAQHLPAPTRSAPQGAGGQQGPSGHTA